MKGIEILFPGVKALDGVDFSLRAGEVHALLGENGAGKSTLIKCLTGVHHMDAGTILLNGKEIIPTNPQDAFSMGISTVYQEINLCPNLTVAENIFVGRQPMKGGMINWKEINRRASELMKRFHMDIDVTRPLSYYSTAIQQMVSIARAVDIDAKVLILDEPTSSLDDNEVQLLFDVMNELKAEGMGIIFITHFLDQVFAVSDRLTILRNGRLIGTFDIHDITKLQLVTYMIGKDMDAIFNLKRADVAADAPEMLRTENLGAPGQIQNVNLSIRKGELMGFAGPNRFPSKNRSTPSWQNWLSARRTGNGTALSEISRFERTSRWPCRHVEASCIRFPSRSRTRWQINISRCFPSRHRTPKRRSESSPAGTSRRSFWLAGWPHSRTC